MSINMSNVKQIMHNNKEVIKIEDSLGHILWQKESQASWHTVWEGSVFCEGYVSFTFSPPRTYTTGDGTVLYTVDTTTLPNPESIQCRVTFSGMKTYGSTTTSTPSNKTSPYTITGIDTAKTIIQAEGTSSNNAYYAYAKLRISRSGNTSSFNISCYTRAASRGNNYGGEFTVKKIELYY